MMSHAITWWKESNSSNGFWEICSDPLPKGRWMCKEPFSFFSGSWIFPKPVLIIYPSVLSFSCAIFPLLLLLLLLSHFSPVWLCVIPEMAAHQAPPSLGFSRQEHWSGLPLPSPSVKYIYTNRNRENEPKDMSTKQRSQGVENVLPANSVPFMTHCSPWFGQFCPPVSQG